MGYKLLIFAALAVLGGLYLQKKFGYSPVYKSDQKLHGRTVLITGGNTGIGEAVAIEFAKRGAKVIIASRNDAKSERAQKHIIEQSKNPNVFSYHLDLEDFKSVKDFAQRYDKEHEHLDYLINNAGVLTLRGTSPNGYTRLFNINHFGHFLLTDLLMDKMKKQAKDRPVRIINVSSGAYKVVSKLDFKEIKESATNLIGDFISYGYTKLANIYFTSELHKRHASDGITSYAVHPGLVATELGLNLPLAYRIFSKIVASTIRRTPFLGAQTIMYCALDDEVTAESGNYFEDCASAQLPDYAKDQDAAAKLWKESVKVTKKG